MSIEAMKKALDVLVHVTTLSSKKARDSHAKAVSGLREAIATAEKAAPESRTSDGLIEGTGVAKIPRGLILPVDSLPGVKND